MRLQDITVPPTDIGGAIMEILYALTELWTQVLEESEQDLNPGLIINEPMRFEYLM
jgi:hypothetical protein